MQAIKTRFVSPTNFRGSRIKAECQRGSIVVPWVYALDVDANHSAAARALCDKFVAEDQEEYGGQMGGWAKPLVSGHLKDGSHVHIFMPSKA
jgi:hypothetical protein